MPAWLLKLNEHFPIRYLVWLACGVGCLLCLFTWVGFGTGGVAALVFAGLTGLGLRDTRQQRHSVLRN